MAENKKARIEPLKDADTPLSFRFNVLSKKYYGAATKHFEELDLDKHLFVLKLISKHEYITQQCLANCLNIDKAGIVRVIDYLSEKGLVKREPSPDDRREHRIVATKKAASYIPKITDGFTMLNKEAFKGFTKQEVQLFYSMMNKMLDNLSLLPSEEVGLKYTKKKAG